MSFTVKRAGVKTLHHVSGIILSLFIALHLVNHLAALAGPEKHIALMEKFRLVYRNPIVESLLLFVVFFQIISGIRLLFGQHATHWVEKVQRYSGMYLSFFLLQHVAAVLIGRYMEHLDTNFWYAAAGMNLFPTTFFFFPYYFLSVAAISLHIAALHYLRTKSARTSWLIVVVGLISSFLILIAFTNGFNWYTIPADYKAFILRIIGRH